MGGDQPKGILKKKKKKVREGKRNRKADGGKKEMKRTAK